MCTQLHTIVGSLTQGRYAIAVGTRMLGHRARGVGRARGGMWVMVFALRLTLGMDTVCVTKCAA